MSLIFTTTHLKQALDTVRNVVNPRAEKPIHTCVLLTSEPEGVLTIQAYNAVFSVTTAVKSICANGVKEILAVNELQLGKFVSWLDDDAVIECDFSDKNNTVEFRSGKHVAKFRTYPADEFPAPPAVVETHSFEVDSAEFQKALKLGGIAVLDSKSNVVNASLKLFIQSGTLSVLTYDFARVAVANDVQTPNTPDGEFLLPKQTAEYLRRLPLSDEPVKVGFNDRAMRIQSDYTVVYTTRTSGKLEFRPESIPTIFARNIEIPRADFQQAVNVVSVLMAGDEDKKVLNLVMDGGKMMVQPVFAPDTDLSTSELECDHGDESFRAKLTVSHLKDWFSVVGGENVWMRSTDVDQIISLESEKHPDFKYYVAPIISKQAEAA